MKRFLGAILLLPFLYQNCGEIRMNSVQVPPPANEETPQPSLEFLPDLKDVEDALPATLVSSSIISVGGYAGSIEVSGPGNPELRKEGGTWSTKLTTFVNDRIQFRVNSPERVASSAEIEIKGPVTKIWNIANSICPRGFVQVKAKAPYTSKDFCVAEFEGAYEGGGFKVVHNSISLATSRTTAKQSCESLGTGYSLITNDQWQTVASEIIDNSKNWSSGQVGEGQLNVGHILSDFSNNACRVVPPPADKSKTCEGTVGTCTGDAWHLNRRTHFLASGKVIWDIGGNTTEWMSDEIPVGAYSASGNVTAIVDAGFKAKFGAHRNLACSGDGCRAGMAWYGVNVANGSGGFNLEKGNGLQRGGSYWNHPAGILTVWADYKPDVIYCNLGAVRCVYQAD